MAKCIYCKEETDQFGFSLCLNCKRKIQIGETVIERLWSGIHDPFLTPEEKSHLPYLWSLIHKFLPTEKTYGESIIGEALSAMKEFKKQFPDPYDSNFLKFDPHRSIGAGRTMEKAIENADENMLRDGHSISDSEKLIELCWTVEVVEANKSE